MRLQLRGFPRKSDDVWNVQCFLTHNYIISILLNSFFSIFLLQFQMVFAIGVRRIKQRVVPCFPRPEFEHIAADAFVHRFVLEFPRNLPFAVDENEVVAAARSMGRVVFFGTEILPVSHFSSPKIIRNRVVLPWPFLPTSPILSPLFTLKLAVSKSV